MSAVKNRTSASETANRLKGILWWRLPEEDDGEPGLNGRKSGVYIATGIASSGGGEMPPES